ncbi:hypothetical protein MARA_02940 (plasmid) [Mycolicibacterium arabiense]|uniref:Uncharacterized protein n=1 Tax=Mycolicibacterium arabiense TaxID=1286181 RepID=A0A7I7RQN7_9MYCO|nr:hypothetical protein MARA_02940 [Mycolicibacterium arabiense]
MSTTFVRALCCDCGQLRDISTRAGRRNDDNKSFDDGVHPAGWRMTQTLKCSNCGQLTRHATLRDDVGAEYRDRAEERMTGCPVCEAEDHEPCICPVSGGPLGLTHRGRQSRMEPNIDQ